MVAERIPEAVRHQLAEANIGLVVSRVPKFRPRGVDIADLVSAGNIGLMEAIDSFNPDLAQFTTHAVPEINKMMHLALHDTRMVRLPEYIIGLKRDLYKLENQWYAQHNSLPTDEELISDWTKLRENHKSWRRTFTKPEEALEDMRKIREAIAQRVYSADHTSVNSYHPGGEYGEEPLASRIADTGPSVAGIVEKRQLQEEVWKILRQLEDPKARQVIYWYYGRSLTIGKIAETLNMTPAKIKSIKKTALDKLRQTCEAGGLDSFLVDGQD